MIKKLLILTVVGLPFMLNAQSDAGFGLQIGAHNAIWYGPDVENMKLASPESEIVFGKGFGNSTSTERVLLNNTAIQDRRGFHTGIQINSEISDYFWLKHEFMFSTNGFTFEGDKQTKDSSGNWVDAGKTEMRFRTYNADIMPLSLCGHFYGLQAYAGPYISVNIDQGWVEVDTDGSVMVSAIEYGDFEYKPKNKPASSVRDINVLDYGLVAGFEYEFPFGLNFSIYHKRGFAPVFETPSGELQVSAFNKSTGVSMGFTFGKE